MGAQRGPLRPPAARRVAVRPPARRAAARPCALPAWAAAPRWVRPRAPRRSQRRPAQTRADITPRCTRHAGSGLGAWVRLGGVAAHRPAGGPPGAARQLRAASFPSASPPQPRSVHPRVSSRLLGSTASTTAVSHSIPDGEERRCRCVCKRSRGADPAQARARRLELKSTVAAGRLARPRDLTGQVLPVGPATARVGPAAAGVCEAARRRMPRAGANPSVAGARGAARGESAQGAADRPDGRIGPARSGSERAAFLAAPTWPLPRSAFFCVQSIKGAGPLPAAGRAPAGSDPRIRATRLPSAPPGRRCGFVLFGITSNT